MLLYYKKQITIFLLCVASATCNADQQYLLNTLFTYVPSAHFYSASLQALVDASDTTTPYKHAQVPFTYSLPLYRAYPGLQETLPHISLGDLPTPIMHAQQAAALLDIGDFYIKCDGMTGALLEDGSHRYGGNKIRKLEFLFADALVHGAETVVTFGCVGSNHATATASCAEQIGLRSISLLKPQPHSNVVRKNLLLMDSFGSTLQFFPNNKVRELGALDACLQNKIKNGDFPYVIPTGGSCPLGAVGFVNAAFELQDQINAGLLAQPDYIYVAAGSKGTIAGLLLGARVIGLQSVIVPVCVEPENPQEFAASVRDLIQRTNALLHSLDAQFPIIDVATIDLPIIYDCCGQDYGVFSPEGVEAMELIKKTEDVVLEGTYTGKAFAAVVKDARNGRLQHKKVLFWNTYCPDNFAEQLANRDYKKLPQEFHGFFEQDVQDLDRSAQQEKTPAMEDAMHDEAQINVPASMRRHKKSYIEGYKAGYRKARVGDHQ